MVQQLARPSTAAVLVTLLCTMTKHPTEMGKEKVYSVYNFGDFSSSRLGRQNRAIWSMTARDVGSNKFSWQWTRKQTAHAEPGIGIILQVQSQVLWLPAETDFLKALQLSLLCHKLKYWTPNFWAGGSLQSQTLTMLIVLGQKQLQEAPVKLGGHCWVPWE